MCFCDDHENQWRGERQAGGEAALPIAPQWHLFFLWSGTCVQQVQRRALVGVQGENPLEAPKNLHPTVPETGSKIDQKHVDGYTFFMCIAVQSHRKIRKVTKFLIFKFLIRNEMCMFYVSS